MEKLLPEVSPALNHNPYLGTNTLAGQGLLDMSRDATSCLSCRARPEQMTEYKK